MKIFDFIVFWDHNLDGHDQLVELKARLTGYQNGSALGKWRMDLTKIRKQLEQ